MKPQKQYSREERIARAKRRAMPCNVPGMRGWIAPRSMRVRAAMTDAGRDVSLFSTHSLESLKQWLPRIRKNGRILYIFAPSERHTQDQDQDRWRALVERYPVDYEI